MSANNFMVSLTVIMVMVIAFFASIIDSAISTRIGIDAMPFQDWFVFMAMIWVLGFVSDIHIKQWEDRQ